MKIKKPVQIDAVCGIQCDRCKREEDIDSMEAQEFVSIEMPCGYLSIFGDGNNIAVDLCQHCVKEVLGEHLRITHPDL